MQELKGICKKCLGCNKLENFNFIGTNYCENFKGDKNVLSKIWEQKSIDKWNMV